MGVVRCTPKVSLRQKAGFTGVTEGIEGVTTRVLPGQNRHGRTISVLSVTLFRSRYRVKA